MHDQDQDEQAIDALARNADPGAQPFDPARHFPLVYRFRFTLQAVTALHLPPFPGSTWRGAIGHGLRKTACITRQPTCDACLLRTQCAYPLLYDTPPEALGLPTEHQGTRERFNVAPHPYVLHIEQPSATELDPEETLSIGVSLLGETYRLLPYWVQALRLAGEQGVGRDSGRFVLSYVDQEVALGSGHWQQIMGETTSG